MVKSIRQNFQIIRPVSQWRYANGVWNYYFVGGSESTIYLEQQTLYKLKQMEYLGGYVDLTDDNIKSPIIDLFVEFNLNSPFVSNDEPATTGILHSSAPILKMPSVSFNVPEINFDVVACTINGNTPYLNTNVFIYFYVGLLFETDE